MTEADPSKYGQIVVAEPLERLPYGWTEKVGSSEGGEVKFYHNVITGMKFYSKADLLRYVELGSPSQGTRQRVRAQHEGNPDNTLMLMPAVTDNTPEWLPQGWIVELNAVSTGRKYKTYIELSTGRKFHSKPAILKYLNSDECNDPMAKQIAMSIASALPVAVDNISENTPEWLPQGWLVELNTRSNGRKFKRYIDPLTRQKFYSKPEVMTYLSSDKSNNPTSEQTAIETFKPRKSVKGTSSKSSQKQRRSSSSQKKHVEVVRYETEGLPPGWIKEIKYESTGNKMRKDPFYTDPDSKYVFRSVPDALRYLETKDIRSCIIKPRKREELEFLPDDTSLHISEEKQLLLEDNNNKAEDFTEKEENQAPISGHLATALGSKRKRGKPVAAPSPDNVLQQEKPAEVSIDHTKSDSVQVINGEKGDKQNVEPQPVERLGGDSSMYPCLEFAFKTLRGDNIPVEANNNYAAQGFNHQQRAPVSVRLPSFSDYARRPM